MVYLPKEKVLFSSEIYLNHLFPAMRSAYPTEWMQVFNKLQKIDARMVIPGHGFVDDEKTLKEELKAYIQSVADAAPTQLRDITQVVASIMGRARLIRMRSPCVVRGTVPGSQRSKARLGSNAEAALRRH